MTLNEYLKTRGKQKELAQRLKITQGAVSQWATGSQRVTAERAIDIELATDGAVTRQELRPDVYSVPPVIAEKA
jgi:DNA-binding transcriptional regulator YdaS (Cro superfamily)